MSHAIIAEYRNIWRYCSVLDGGPKSGEQNQLHSRPATSLGYNHASDSAHLMSFDGLFYSSFDVFSPNIYFSGTQFSDQIIQACPIDILERDLGFGSSLYRVSTTPLSSTANNDRTTIEQARNVKLTKMGFAPNEQASRLPPAQTKVFGGLNFKNLMQTFKGKAWRSLVSNYLCHFFSFLYYWRFVRSILTYILYCGHCTYAHMYNMVAFCFSTCMYYQCNWMVYL